MRTSIQIEGRARNDYLWYHIKSPEHKLIFTCKQISKNSSSKGRRWSYSGQDFLFFYTRLNIRLYILAHSTGESTFNQFRIRIRRLQILQSDQMYLRLNPNHSINSINLLVSKIVLDRQLAKPIWSQCASNDSLSCFLDSKIFVDFVADSKSADQLKLSKVRLG